MGSAVAEPGAPAEAPAEATSRWGRTPLVFLVAGIVVVLDQASKSWAVGRLTGRGPIHVVGSLQFDLQYNPGSAFSLAQSLGPYLGLLAVFVVIALAFSGRSARTTGSAIVIGLLIGGALGNLADRALRSSPGHTGFMHGAVVDFIDLQWWPVFNIADAAIVVGAILLAVYSLRGERKPSAPEPAS